MDQMRAVAHAVGPPASTNGGNSTPHPTSSTQAALPGALASEVQGVPTYVMLPLDTVNAEGVFRYASSKWFNEALQTLQDTGIRGVAVDVWWGAVERRPRRYDWSGYRQLFAMVAALGLKVQAVMSFHACGGNVGDNAQVPLPGWVLAAGERDPDIFFTDRPREQSAGRRNRECVSLFADEEPGLLRGRSPMQCYTDFMRAFRDEFHEELGMLVEEVVVGAGPCGELRYPSYPETNGWRFPGVGEFQCYDRRALASLARAAAEVGHPEWGNSGPHDAGHYNSNPEDSGFFSPWGGSWESPYGAFFLRWYATSLIDHGDRLLASARGVFNVKLPGTSPGLRPSPAAWPVGSPRSAGASTVPSRSGSGIEDATTPPSPPPPAAQWPAPDAASALDRGEAQPFVPDMFDAGLVSGAAPSLLQQPRSPARLLGDRHHHHPANHHQPAGGLRRSATFGVLPVSADPPRVPLCSPPGPVGMAAAAAGEWTAGSLPTGLRYQASHGSLRSFTSDGAEDWSLLRLGDTEPEGAPIELTMKVAGVHWWFRTRSHPAELTAGYYNSEGSAGVGYDAIIAMCASHGAGLTLTCVEMCDAQHPPEALCGPEGLLRQLRESCTRAGVALAGENALPCFMPGVIDEIALQRVVYNTQPWGTPLEQGSSGRDGQMLGRLSSRREMISTAESAVPQSNPNSLPPAGWASGRPWQPDFGAQPRPSGGDNAAAQLPPLRAFTFLRLTREMMADQYQDTWHRFMGLMVKNGTQYRSSPTWRRNMGFE